MARHLAPQSPAPGGERQRENSRIPGRIPVDRSEVLSNAGGKVGYADTNRNSLGTPILLLLFLAAGWSIMAVTLIRWTGMDPKLLYLMALVYAVLVLPLLQLQKHRGFRFAAVALPVAVLTLCWLFPSSRQEFLRRFGHVREGMTLEEVDQVMAGYIRGTGWHSPFEAGQELEVANSVVYRHDNAGAQNSDWGMVELRHGRVVRTEFSPD